MSRSTWKTLLVGGSTLTGGIVGSWATTRAGVNFGCQLGPWGVVVGAVAGALVGAVISEGLRMPGDTEIQAA